MHIEEVGSRNFKSNLFLEVQAVAGSDLIDVSYQMCVLAYKLGVNIQFNFNGIKLIAYPDSNYRDLVRDYYETVHKT